MDSEAVDETVKWLDAQGIPLAVGDKVVSKFADENEIPKLYTVSGLIDDGKLCIFWPTSSGNLYEIVDPGAFVIYRLAEDLPEPPAAPHRWPARLKSALLWLGPIGFALWWVIKILACTFLGVCFI